MQCRGQALGDVDTKVPEGSLLLPKVHYQLLGLFTVICDQANHGCVTSKLDDGVGIARAQQGAQNTALGCSSFKDEGGRGVSAHPGVCPSGSQGSTCTVKCLIPGP